MSELVDKATWLVSVPSQTGQEEDLCHQLVNWAQRLPGSQIYRQRHGLRIQPGPVNPEKAFIALVGHIDTVPPAQQQRLGVDGQRLYGCGASDMKAGIAVMMQLMENYRDFPVNLVGLFYDREEGPYADNGLESLLQQDANHPLPRTQFAVVLEPTNNEIHAGCVGSLQARVHFLGQRAHSARPWQGLNAIYKSLSFLQKLSNLGRKSVICEGLEFFEVITATQANSLGPTNAVPEKFTVNVNSRFAPGRTSQEAIDQLKCLVGTEAEVEIYDVAPSGPVDLSHPGLQNWIQRNQLRVMPKQAWTDVARLAAHKIAAFNFGPGDPGQAHQADEFVLIPQIEENHRKLRDLLLNPGGVETESTST